MTIKKITPVALFAYKRLDHLQRTIVCLQANELADQTHLYVYCDGARQADDAAAVAAVRNYVRSIDGFAEVTPVFRERNLGLAASIIGGVSEVLAMHEQLIVLEDDMETTPFFLRFMNDALAVYRDEPQLASIHAYALPLAGLPANYFMRGADCWGWATWRDRWQIFNGDSVDLLQKLQRQGLLRQFNSYGFRPLFLLVKQALGEIDSWYIRWHAANFLAGRLTLHVGQSFVHNTGTDGSGTHGDDTQSWQSMLAGEYSPPLRLVAIEDAAVIARINAWYLRSPTERLRSAAKTFLAYVGLLRLWLQGRLG